MKNKYFYTKAKNNASLESNNILFNEIRIDDIKELADFAVSLDSSCIDDNVLNYFISLIQYFQYNCNELKECYEKITSDGYGSDFLCTNIAILLIERKLKGNNITPQLLKVYSDLLNLYSKQLELNDKLVTDISFNRKRR